MQIHRSDTELLQQLKNSNEQALTELFERYYEPLCRFVIVFLPNQAIVEELTANIFIKLWNQRKTIQIHTGLKSYLYQAAKNQALTYLRKKHIVISSDDGEMNFGGEEEYSPESFFIESELRSEFKKAFKKIPPRAKLAFKLHRFDGLKYTDIAAIMDISVSAVEKNIGKALKILHRELIVFTIHR